MVASRSLYALWVGTSGPEGEASGCEEGNDTIRVGYWFDSAGTSAFAGCGYGCRIGLGSFVPQADYRSAAKALDDGFSANSAVCVGLTAIAYLDRSEWAASIALTLLCATSASDCCRRTRARKSRLWFNCCTR